ncbi:MAG TPA: TRAP transporter large permease [Syntrophales bacterium]|nr:TRAP transporter large permease [Syntrophales bacterium]HPQ45274.1 TRAP transporter large permease [Syntrophales bacterium]
MLTVSIFTVLLAFIIMNMPIAAAMGLTAIIFFIGLGNGSLLTMLPQRMYASTTGFTLLAIPFFILAANLMNTGGITSRIFRFAKALIGHIPGGLGQVCVIANVIFSGMSGSAIADAAGLGQVLHKAMVDNGFKPKFSASIVAAAAAIGPVIPPSIPFVLYGALTGVSVGKLFLAGFIPGTLMALAIMIAIAFLAKRYDLPKEKRADFREIVVSTKEAFLPLLTPVIIIGGILSGIFTPTEAAVVASLYALFLGFFYRDLKLKDLPEIFWISIKQTISLLFIISTAGFFGWLTIHQKIPDQIILSLTSMSLSPFGIMAMIIGIVMILGCFLEGNAIFIITIPIFMLIAQQFGIDLINLGVVMTLLIMVGNLTPPVGMCLFAVSTFSKVSIGTLSQEIVPYLIGIFIVTVLIAYIPQISTFLPNLIMGP